MAKDKQTIILETSRSFKNASTVLDVCGKAITNYMQENFNGLTDEEIVEKVKTILSEK